MLKNAHGRHMHHHELYPLLGLKRGEHLPDAGWVARTVDLPDGQRATFECKAASGNGRRSKHRIRYLCPCGKSIPFGRVGQHQKGRQHQEDIQ